MARIRYLKPQLVEDEALSEVSIEAEHLYCLLWCHMDRQGLVEASARLAKGRMFPLRDTVSTKDCQRWINELIEKRLLYRVANVKVPLLYCPTLVKHQKFHKTEKNRYNLPESLLTEAVNAQPELRNVTSTQLAAVGMGNGELVMGNGKLATESIGESSRELVAPQKDLQKTKTTNPEIGIFIGTYVKAFQGRYGSDKRPDIRGKVQGQIKSYLKDIPLLRACVLVQVYLQMEDSWFKTKYHDFTTFLENQNKIIVTMGDGKEKDYNATDLDALGRKLGYVT